MGDNIVKFRRDDCISAEDVQEAIQLARLDRLFALGFNKDGELFVECSCNFEAGALVLALERFKFELMKEMQD